MRENPYKRQVEQPIRRGPNSRTKLSSKQTLKIKRITKVALCAAVSSEEIRHPQLQWKRRIRPRCFSRAEREREGQLFSPFRLEISEMLYASASTPRNYSQVSLQIFMSELSIKLSEVRNGMQIWLRLVKGGASFVGGWSQKGCECPMAWCTQTNKSWIHETIAENKRIAMKASRGVSTQREFPTRVSTIEKPRRNLCSTNYLHGLQLLCADCCLYLAE